LRSYSLLSQILLILLAGMLSVGSTVPSSSFAEIYKYEDEAGVVHLTNVPDEKYNLVLREGWERLHPRINLGKYDPVI